MAYFLRAILDRQGLSADAYRAMLSPQIRIHSVHEFPTPSFETTHRDDHIDLAYGHGWGHFRSRYGPAFFKEGHDDDSWQNFMIGFDDSQTGVVLLSSSAHAESMYPALLTALLGETDIPAEWMGYGKPQR
jgi:hypothetical protein